MTPEKLEVDLSEWHLADWPQRLLDCVTIETDKSNGQIEIKLSLDSEAFDAAVRRIGKEMIESFFQTSVFAQAISEGVRLHSDDTVEWQYREDGGEIIIPWEGSADVADIEIASGEVAKRLAEVLGRAGQLMDIPLDEIMGWISSQYRPARRMKG